MDERSKKKKKAADVAPVKTSTQVLFLTPSPGTSDVEEVEEEFSFPIRQAPVGKGVSRRSVVERG